MTSAGEAGRRRSRPLHADDDVRCQPRGPAAPARPRRPRDGADGVRVDGQPRAAGELCRGIARDRPGLASERERGRLDRRRLFCRLRRRRPGPGEPDRPYRRAPGVRRLFAARRRRRLRLRRLRRGSVDGARAALSERRRARRRPHARAQAAGRAHLRAVAGAVDAVLGWRATFAIGGVAPLSALAAVALLPPAVEAVPAAGFAFDFRPLLRNRALMAYVLAFAGNLWEVSAVWAWFVAYLAWTLGLPHHRLQIPAPAVISGLAALAGFPASLLVAELALRWGPRAIVATCLASIAILLGLAASAGGPALVSLPLLIAAQIAAPADASALAAGAVAVADPARRGAALALYACAGYVAACVGPVAVGFALDAFGGAGSPSGWRAAFIAMALGSAAAAVAMRAARGARNWN